MTVLKRLTDDAYIVESESLGKIGLLIDYSKGVTDKTGLEFISGESVTHFSTLSDLEAVLGELTFKEEEVKTETTKVLDDYPVNDTDNVIDVQSTEEGLSTFRKSTRSTKRFYPGWWAVRNEKGITQPKLTISLDIYNEKCKTGDIQGPFKTHMECSHVAKGM